jgi:hypothetical protein
MLSAFLPNAVNTTGGADPAFLYFQYLSANLKWSRREIHGFMAKQVFVDTFSAELSKILMDSGFAETFTSFETSFIDNSIPDADRSKIVNNYAVKAKKFAVPTTLPGSPFNVQVSPTGWSITELAKTSFKPE